MSLGRIALRMAVTQALKGNTPVGDNVHDSMIGGLDIGADQRLRSDQDRPFMAVYAESSKEEVKDIQPRGLYANGSLELVIEWGVAVSMASIDPNTGASEMTSLGLPATDDVLELQMDLIGRCIMDALSDPDNIWAEVFRLLVIRIEKIERYRTASNDKGVRLAGQQLRLSLMMMDDPLPSKEGEGDYPEAITLLFQAIEQSGDDDLASRARLIRSSLAGQYDDAALLRHLKGLSHAETTSLGATLKGETLR